MLITLSVVLTPIRLIEADIQAQWLAVPRSCRLECGLKACDRRPVERDFMVNMKLNYLHVQFLLRLALVRPMSTEPDSELLEISLKMLGLVVETILLKDQIVNSGTSLVWKVGYVCIKTCNVLSNENDFEGRILRLVRCGNDMPNSCQALICHPELYNKLFEDIPRTKHPCRRNRTRNFSIYRLTQLCLASSRDPNHKGYPGSDDDAFLGQYDGRFR